MTSNPLFGVAMGLGTLAILVLLLLVLQRRMATLRQLKGPLYVLALAISLGVAGFFPAEGSEDLALRAWQIGLALVALAALHFLAIYFFEGVLRARRGLRIPPLIPRVITGVVYAVGFVITLRVLNDDLDLGPLLATSAVTSLVLGLALQPILGNFFAGLVISVERPFRINDWVQVSGTEARVVDITWRATHLRTRDNDNLIIPNSRIAEHELINFYYPHTLHLERIVVGVHYKSPPYRVTEALLEAARSVPEVLDRPSPDVYLLEFGDSAIQYELRIWIQDIADRPRLENEVRRRIWEKFNQRGLVIPFPIRTLEIEPAANLVQTRAADESALEATPGWLFVEDGVDRGLSIALGDEGVTIGRGADCDLVLRDPQVSKEQCRIERDGDRFVVVDVEGRRGTRIGGRAVKKHVLRRFERIQIGETMLVFEQGGPVEQTGP